MTDKECKITWKSNITGFEGEGERVLDPKEALEAVRDANLENPNITHQADCKPDAAPASTPTDPAVFAARNSSVNNVG